MNTASILQMFNRVANELSKQIQTMVAFGLSVSDEAMKVHCGGNRMTEIVKTGGEKEVNRDRFNSFCNAAVREIRLLQDVERRFLRSLQTSHLLREKIVRLSPGAYRANQASIESRFARWDDLRSKDGVPLEKLRATYSAAVREVDRSYQANIEDTIKAILNPAPVRQVSRRSDTERVARRLERLAAQPKKGSKSESPDTDGQSKKSKAKKRQRARMEATA